MLFRSSTLRIGFIQNAQPQNQYQTYNVYINGSLASTKEGLQVNLTGTYLGKEVKNLFAPSTCINTPCNRTLISGDNLLIEITLLDIS